MVEFHVTRPISDVNEHFYDPSCAWSIFSVKIAIRIINLEHVGSRQKGFHLFDNGFLLVSLK